MTGWKERGFGGEVMKGHSGREWCMMKYMKAIGILHRVDEMWVEMITMKEGRSGQLKSCHVKFKNMSTAR